MLKFEYYYKNGKKYIAEKYWLGHVIEPRASRLTYERSTTKLSRSIQLCYLILGFILIALVSYRVRGATLESFRVCGGAKWYMFVGCYKYIKTPHHV